MISDQFDGVQDDHVLLHAKDLGGRRESLADFFLLDQELVDEQVFAYGERIQSTVAKESSALRDAEKVSCAQTLIG